MAEPIRVVVDGRAAPKGSRTYGRTRSGTSYTYPASKFEAPWVNAVANATMVVMAHACDPGPPYEVELVFRMKRAKEARYEWPVRADLDKLVRAVIDGLVKGRAMKDDQHVIRIVASEHYATDGEVPGVTALVRHAEI